MHRRSGSTSTATTPPHSSLRGLLPARADYAQARETWRGDVVAGVTVGVVALPLALGFGEVTGLGAGPGLITAIVAGLVAAIFGGSHVQVSGPTGAMAVVLVPVVAEHGAAAIPLVAILAGLLVMAGGLLRLGRAVTLLPWPVVEGFTVGIAMTIFLQQVPLLVGEPVAGEDPLPAAWGALTGADWAQATPAVAIALAVVAVMLVLQRLRPSWPASLVAVAAATLVTVPSGVDVATIGAIPAGLPVPDLALPGAGAFDTLARAALVVALLAALESLLSARVADGMATIPATRPDRELVGQGLASVASGLFGGMPATGAIARTAVNVRSGARTRIAAIVHALVLLLVLVAASGIVAHIPIAALVGVLMVTSIRMVERGNVRAIMLAGRSDALVLVLTAVTTVAVDLVLAVEVGVVVAALLALRSLARSTRAREEQLESLRDEHRDGGDEYDELLALHVVVYRIEGSMFFGAAQRMLDDLTSVRDVRVVVLRLGWVGLFDATGAHALRHIVADLNGRGVDVLLCGVQPRHERVLAAGGMLQRMREEGRVFTRIGDAIDHATELAARRD